MKGVIREHKEHKEKERNKGERLKDNISFLKSSPPPSLPLPRISTSSSSPRS